MCDFSAVVVRALGRYPYSFLGGDRAGRGAMPGAPPADGAKTPEPLTETWHDALLGYAGNNPRARDQVQKINLVLISSRVYTPLEL